MHSQIAASHVHRCDYCAYHLPVVLSIERLRCTFGVYQTIATSDSAVLMAVFLKNMVNKVNGLSMHQWFPMETSIRAHPPVIQTCSSFMIQSFPAKCNTKTKGTIWSPVTNLAIHLIKWQSVSFQECTKKPRTEHLCWNCQLGNVFSLGMIHNNCQWGCICRLFKRLRAPRKIGTTVSGNICSKGNSKQ